MLNGWSDTPTVVLLEVFAYLPVQDRLNASAVCTNWRAPVFQAPLYDKLELNLNNYELDRQKVTFLSSNFVHKVPTVHLKFNPISPSCLDLVGEILEKLAGNTGLRTLKLSYTEELLGSELFHDKSMSALILRKYFSRKVIQPLLKVLQSKNCLKDLSCPLTQELMVYQPKLYSTLINTNKVYILENLFLPTIRSPSLLKSSGEELSSTLVKSSSLDITNIARFSNLQMLSIDHDILTDAILTIIGTGSACGGMKRLNLVAVKGNQNVSNAGWTNFIANNPKCGVRLTVMGGTLSFGHQANLIFPSVPITHFKALYCKEMSVSALNSLISWNENILEHLEFVNENFDWMDYIVADEINQNEFIDPLIFAAWRCKQLSTIRIGYMYCGASLIGIARLKGPKLTCLEIPKSQVVHQDHYRLSNEISRALCRKWKPTDDSGNKVRVRPRRVYNRIANTVRALVLDEN